MIVKSGQTWTGMFSTRDSTGALATPSVGPAGVLYVDGTANGATVTISGSNPYKWTVTLPSLTAGQTVSMYITATIASIATASFPSEAIADTVRLSDTLTANPASGGITSSSFASGAITAASIASDAIGASELAADAVAEIADAIWDEAYSGHTTAGTFGKLMDILRKSNRAVDGEIAAGATPTTTTFRTNLTAATGAFNHELIVFLDNGLQDQARPISTYVQTNGVITLQEALTSAPAVGDTFVILPQHIHPITDIATQVHTELQTEFDDLTALLNSGIYSYSDTVTDGTNPLDGVQVELYSDSGLTIFVTKTTTNASGQFTVYSDTAGTHYLRLQKAGYAFASSTAVTLA